MGSRALRLARRAGLAAACALSAAAPALPAAGGDAPAGAVVAEARLPRRLACGQRFPASVTMTNTGVASWTSAQMLGAAGGEDPFTEEVRALIPAGVEVAPGRSHTFRFELTAPDIPLARARTAWTMIGEDGAPFGEIAARDVRVDCKSRVDDAEIVAADLPATLACGERYAAQITLRNTGDTRWTRDAGYVLGAGEDGERFGAARLALPERGGVAPAAEATFETVLVAPTVRGTYRLEWRMTRSGGGSFGAPVTQDVRVACAP